MTHNEPAWLADRRARALSRLKESQLPRWKGTVGWEFTDLGEFSLADFPAVKQGPGGGELSAVASPIEIPENAIELIEVDGHLSVSTQDPPDGVVVASLAQAASEHPALVQAHFGRVVSADGDDIFACANESLWADGVFVYIPHSVRLAQPIFLTGIAETNSTAHHRRILVVLEAGAQAEIWEHVRSAPNTGETLQNTVTELVVGENAQLHYLSVQDLNERSWVFGSHRAEVARDGVLDWATLAFGSGNGRVRLETLLAGEGAEAKVTGAYAPHGRQHIDFDTTQEHAAPNTRSDLAFRGILADRSSAVWRGMIKVDPGAQKTEAFQECRNLLLSKRAHADAIPGLEILANDVRCTHAAAIAQIDPEQLFYLRSRGLAPGVATQLVIEGFMAELVERFPEGPIRSALRSALDQRLQLLLS